MTEPTTSKWDNPIATIYNGYTNTVKSPLVNTALWTLLAYGTGRGLRRPINETLRTLFRKPGTAVFKAAGDPDPDKSYNEALDELKGTNIIPWLMAGTAAVASLYPRFDKNKPWYGYRLYSDQPKLFKQSSFEPSFGYETDIDWHQNINAGVANSLFMNDSHLQDNSYARHMGMSIVNNAAITNQTNTPSLGNIFDSAVSKFDSKLNLEGVLKAGTRAVVANGAARLFTSALGTMCDLNPKVRQGIVDAGTWAGAITTLFD